MGILDVIFPKKCLNCRREGSYLCVNCILKVSKPKPICPYCRKPSIYGMTHPECGQREDIDGLVSGFRYKGVVRKAILALKYKYATEIAGELTNYLVKELESRKEIFKKGVVLIPVPLHWRRGNLRGFNQSEIIGKKIAQKLNWKFIPDFLIRKKPTVPQTTLKRELRGPNIKKAFEISNEAKEVSFPSIILFDDVFTTGSTLKEAALVLKENGAKSVWGLTIAR